MKKLLLALLLVCTLNAQGQCVADGEKKSLHMSIELGMQTSLRNKGMTMHGYHLDLGVVVYKHLSVLGGLDIQSHHLREDGIKSYYNSVDLGGGLMYDFIDKPSYSLPLKLKIGSTIGSPDWKHTFYDTSLSWNQLFGKSKVAGVLGIGYRYEKSRNDLMPSHGFVYFTAGIKL